tara:strand:- start:3488 stop:5101 length:1614 start_codon:yes stop_codon:yes gene_type:complete
MAKLSQFAQKSLRDSFKDASGMLTGFGQGIPPVQPAQQFNTGGGLGKSVRNIAGILTGRDFSTDEEIYKDKLESATGTREILVVQRDYARSRGDTAGALEAQMKIDAFTKQEEQATGQAKINAAITSATLEDLTPGSVFLSDLFTTANKYKVNNPQLLQLISNQKDFLLKGGKKGTDTRPDVQKIWDEFSKEEKAKYNNSFNTFVKSYKQNFDTGKEEEGKITDKETAERLKKSQTDFLDQDEIIPEETKQQVKKLIEAGYFKNNSDFQKYLGKYNPLYKEMPAEVEKILNDRGAEIENFANTVSESSSLAAQIERIDEAKWKEGDIPVWLEETRTGLLGGRTTEQETRKAAIFRRSQELVRNLPPGVASDKDIELILAGLPADSAGKREWINYLSAMARVAKAKEEKHRFESDYISSQKTVAHLKTKGLDWARKNKLVSDTIESFTNKAIEDFENTINNQSSVYNVAAAEEIAKNAVIKVQQLLGNRINQNKIDYNVQGDHLPSWVVESWLSVAEKNTEFYDIIRQTNNYQILMDY